MVLVRGGGWVVETTPEEPGNPLAATRIDNPPLAYRDPTPRADERRALAVRADPTKPRAKRRSGLDRERTRRARLLRALLRNGPAKHCRRGTAGLAQSGFRRRSANFSP